MTASGVIVAMQCLNITITDCKFIGNSDVNIYADKTELYINGTEFAENYNENRQFIVVMDTEARIKNC